MAWSSLVGFGLGVLPLVVTPGASFTLATQRTVAGERRAAARVVAGTATGILVHAVLAGAGLSAVVLRSARAFELVRLAGAIYLVALGAHFLWRARRAAATTAARSPGRLPWTGHATYPQALLANLLNPKAASVYLTLAPQFVDARAVGPTSLLPLAAVHVGVMALWLTVWAGLLRGGLRLVDPARLRTVVGRAGGAALVALGLREVAA